MPYFDVANHMTVTKRNMIDGTHCAYGTLRITTVRIWHQVSCRAAQQSQLLSKFPAGFVTSLSFSKIGISYKSNLGADCIHLHHCRCFQEHLRILLQSLRALCLAPGRPGSIWKYVQALLRSTGVSGRFTCGFQTDVHFVDVKSQFHYLLYRAKNC